MARGIKVTVETGSGRRAIYQKRSIPAAASALSAKEEIDGQAKSVAEMESFGRHRVSAVLRR